MSALNASTIEIKDKEDYEILSKSQIYIDKTNNLTLKEIQNKDSSFKANKEKLLGYGYSPDFTLWVKFTLTNTTYTTINNVLEYENPLTTHITFFDLKNSSKQKEGLFHINPNRKTLNPIFKIKLLPNESKTFYIKASSKTTTLIVKLKLWDTENFYEKELKYQFILALFFGAMFILGIYNLFIYFYTKDISYFYYVLYIFGIILHQLVYVGVASTYLLNKTLMIFVIQYASLLVTFPAISLALFTQYFLKINKYPKLNKLFNFSILLVFAVALLYSTIELPQIFRNLLPALLLVLLLATTIYETLKKNHQAYFILLGWFIFLSSGLFMYLSSSGIFNIGLYIKYFVESSLVSEAIIFSIALAYRIKQLQYEKDIANEQLLLQQKNETIVLEKEVKRKTDNLTVALDEKEILLKELNHRVKNNMQTMVSLLRLQIDETEDYKCQEQLLTIQHRINAMSHLHELLYQQDNLEYINANEYISILAYELSDSYNKNIDILLDISINMKTEEAIYCGLIINELVTNSFKYAFTKDQGTISIELFKKDSRNVLIVNDDGVGFDQTQSFSSLGLVLVETLVTKKLNGELNIKSNNGVEAKIIWK